jgi:hypothetical protein
MVYMDGRPTRVGTNRNHGFDLNFYSAFCDQNKAIDKNQLFASSVPVKRSFLVFDRILSTEDIMSLDKIVVLAMAIAFFGGIAFVYWKNRHAEQKTGQTSSPAAPNSVDEDLSNKLQEKARKNSKQ